MAKDQAKAVLGIDLGGTKIYAAAVNRRGKILGSARKKTRGESGFEATVKRMAKCALEAAGDAGLEMSDIHAVGVGSPGPLDLKEGRIIETPNLKWVDAPLKAELEQLLQKPVKVDNDGNVGILGEHAYGAARGADHVIGLFIGTGIGGGVIVNGEPLHGFNDNAGELGHMILDPGGPQCGCGNHGCLEAFASRLAIERDIRIAEIQGVETSVFADMKDRGERLRSKKLTEAFLNGDPAVTLAINRSASYVGFAVASLLNVFNPEVVVLGGGLVEAMGKRYVNLVRKVAKRNVFSVALRNIRIVAAALKDDSAVLGAAVLAWQIPANAPPVKADAQ